MALRDEFLLRGDVVFLNHGSFGACPRPVFEAYQHWQLELERQPVEFLGRRARGLLDEARATLAAYVGAGAGELVFVPNSTFGVNVVARSLPLQPGDEVLATDHEYGACLRAWELACRQRGARVVHARLAPPFRSAEDVVDALWRAVTPRTRAVFVSHITSPTAVTLPVGAIARRAREAGIWSVVDGAHAPGQVDLDLAAIGADFYAGNCHKWLCAPKGAGFLYARTDVQARLTPLVVSWGRPGGGVTPFTLGGFLDEHEWQGTRDYSAYLAVPEAIAFLRRHHWSLVRRECHEIVRSIREQVTALTGLAPLTVDSAEWFAQMSALPLPPVEGPALKSRLYDEHRVEVPITTWNGRQLVRVSVQGYNTAQDGERFVRALAACLNRPGGSAG